VPDEVLRAMHRPAVEIYSGPLLALTDGLMRDIARVFNAVERLWQIAHQIGDPAIVTAADRLMGITLLPLGRLQEAQQCSERVLQAPISPEDQRRSVYHHSEQRAMARAMLACALWLQGLTEKALYESEASLGELRGTDHQLSVCPVLYYGLCRIAPMTGTSLLPIEGLRV
jgi:hypothetical protein